MLHCVLYLYCGFGSNTIPDDFDIMAFVWTNLRLWIASTHQLLLETMKPEQHVKLRSKQELKAQCECTDDIHACSRLECSLQAYALSSSYNCQQHVLREGHGELLQCSICVLMLHWSQHDT